MPPDKKLQTESSEDRIKRLAQQAQDRAFQESMEKRSAVETSTQPTLAEKMFSDPGSRQMVRQLGDTGSSVIGGALGGGPMGAAAGGLASSLSGVIDPNQAQELGSLTNLTNIFAPAVGGAARLFPGGRKAIERFPGLTGALFGGIEGGANAGSRAADSGGDPTAPGLIGTILGAITGGGTAGFQGRLKGLPAAQSPGVRKELSAMAESAGRLPASTSAEDLLQKLTGDMRSTAPYIRTAKEELEQKVQDEANRSLLKDSVKELPKLRATMRAAETAETKATRQAKVDEHLMESAVMSERHKSEDFLRMYPEERARLEAQREQGYKTSNHEMRKDAEAKLQQLNTEREMALEFTSSEAKARQRLNLSREKLVLDYEKKMRQASDVADTARANYAQGRAAAQKLLDLAKSNVTRQKVREDALDSLVNQGIRDPRGYSSEARQALRVLVDDKSFSPQSLFEKTLENRNGSEMMTSGLMEIIGQDPQTKTALRTRYMQHVFDKFQQGVDSNVYGKTFMPDEFMKYVKSLDSRAFNNFMENPDAYANLNALADRLYKSQKGLKNHMLGLSVGVGAAGMAAYAGSHMIGTQGQNTDTGQLILSLATGAAVGGAVGRILSSQHIANELLQAKGARARAIRSFLESDHPELLPNATLKTAINAILTNSKPLEEAPPKP